MVLLFYQRLITGLLGFMGITFLLNLKFYRKLDYYSRRRSGPDKQFQPFVSVLVPARNEAANIGACIQSLLKLDYPPSSFEVLVLDDNSSDDTGAVVEALANNLKGEQGGQPSLRLLPGRPLAEGWLGKNFACHQLAERAAGEFLLFTDADTIHSPPTLRQAVAALESENSDFLSLFPHHFTGSLAERLTVPLVILYVVGLLPTWMVSGSRNPAFSAANGQYMLFRRRAYDKIGGHAAVRERILEDVVLGRRIKEAGLKQLLVDGSEAISCRMYHSAGEVWLGFSKNLFAFFNFKLKWFGLFIALNLAAFVGPYLWLGIGRLARKPANPGWFWFPLLQIILGLGLRLGLALRYGFRPRDAFLQPFSILYMTAIGLNSVKWSRGESEWKGRRYSRPQA